MRQRAEDSAAVKSKLVYAPCVVSKQGVEIKWGQAGRFIALLVTSASLYKYPFHFFLFLISTFKSIWEKNVLWEKKSPPPCHKRGFVGSCCYLLTTNVMVKIIIFHFISYLIHSFTSHRISSLTMLHCNGKLGHVFTCHISLQLNTKVIITVCLSQKYLFQTPDLSLVYWKDQECFMLCVPARKSTFRTVTYIEPACPVIHLIRKDTGNEPKPLVFFKFIFEWINTILCLRATTAPFCNIFATWHEVDSCVVYLRIQPCLSPF